MNYKNDLKDTRNDPSVDAIMLSNSALYHKCLTLNVNNGSSRFINMSTLVTFRSRKKVEVILINKYSTLNIKGIL